MESPAAKNSITVCTEIIVPAIMGFPLQISGSTVIELFMGFLHFDLIIMEIMKKVISLILFDGKLCRNNNFNSV